MDRGIARPRECHRPRRRDRLDVAGSRRSVVARCYVTTLQRIGHAGVEQDRVLAVDLQQPTAATHDPHRLVQPPIGQPEVEDHERLGRRDAGLDRRRQLGERVVGTSADDEAQPVVDCAVGIRRRSPFADAGQQRSLGRRG